MSDSHNPYSRFRGRDLTLNDYLAIDRTVLANERTLLSYTRTALTQVIMGASAMKFFDSTLMVIIGSLFCVSGAVTLIIGTRRYRHTDRLLRVALAAQTGEEAHPLEDEVARKGDERKKTSAV